MGKALFLGNSHVAAYKLAHDQISKAAQREFIFYCAPGADLAFTELRGLRLAPKALAEIGPDELEFFFADGGKAVHDRYIRQRVPLYDVARQLTITGGTPEIDLTDVTEIFYVAGTSPYDFRRLGEVIFPYSGSVRNELLSRMLGSKFLLRNHLAAIRAAAPQVRHYYIGAPLRRWPPVNLNPALSAVLDYNRSIISRLSNNYLFDGVYMPGASVLAEDRVSTRPEFFREGTQQAEKYQGVRTTAEDNLHVNGDYAAIVFEEFIMPLVARPDEKPGATQRKARRAQARASGAERLPLGPDLL